MAPSILRIPCVGLIVPVRFTLSIALVFVSIKANVVAAEEGLDWDAVPGHALLLATALIGVSASLVSIALAGIRDEEKLSPRLRWNCAACGLVSRIALLPLILATIVCIAQVAAGGYFRVNELVLAEVDLILLLICFLVGIVHKLQAMQAANAAGEEEVLKELVKRTEHRSPLTLTSTSTLSTPQTFPIILCNSPDGEIRSLFLSPDTQVKKQFGMASTGSLKQQANLYGAQLVDGGRPFSDPDHYEEAPVTHPFQ